MMNFIGGIIAGVCLTIIAMMHYGCTVETQNHILFTLHIDKQQVRMLLK
jgi:hypothetical protein